MNAGGGGWVGTSASFCAIITITGLASSRLNGLTESALGRINENIHTTRHMLVQFFTFKDKLKLKYSSRLRNEKLTKKNKLHSHLQNQDLENCGVTSTYD